MLAAIGLQGVRLPEPTMGERVVVVIGIIGLIGLLAVQLLRAQGCRVLGIDFDAERLARARSFGGEVVNPGQGTSWLGAGASATTKACTSRHASLAAMTQVRFTGPAVRDCHGQNDTEPGSRE